MKRLHTERLQLIPVEREHKESVYDIYSHPEVCRYYDLEPFASLSLAETHIERWMSQKEKGTAFRYALDLEGQIIGTCGLYMINHRHQRACLGYELLPSYRGKGYMTEALKTMLDYASVELNLIRIQAEVLPENRSSVRLLEKLDFEKEGLFRQYENWGKKGNVDLLIYSRIFDHNALSDL